MANHNGTSLLKKHGLRITESRLSILSQFQNASSALSSQHLIEVFAEQFDRTSIFRTLNAFEEKGIIHSIPNTERGTLFALCGSECSEESHTHEHAHFTCQNCKKVYCIDLKEEPVFKVPVGFVLEDSNIIMKGLCKTCN